MPVSRWASASKILCQFFVLRWLNSMPIGLADHSDHWGKLGAPQHHRQPPVAPPTPDSTDLKTSTKLGMTSTSSRSSIVRTPDLRTSWTHLKKRIALKVWVWSRGPPATLQIPTSFLIPLVGETHGTSGQCVSFFLIDAGSVLLPA